MATTGNTLTNILPTIFARALLALRSKTVMPMLINTDYSDNAQAKGDVISINVPTAVTTGSVTPAETPPAPTATTPGVVTLTLSNWRKSSAFHLSDRDLKRAEVDKTFLPGQFSEALSALVDYVNATIFALYKGVYGYVGTAGVTPFAEATPVVDAATQARKILNRQKCPQGNRRVVLDFDAEAAALALPPFGNAEKIGDQGPVRSGELGHIYGMDWYADGQVPEHTTLAVGTPLVDDGAGIAKGVKLIHMDGLTTKPEAGDVFTINRLSSLDPSKQTYVVTSSTVLAGSDTDISIEPGLTVALAAGDDNSPITFVNTHRCNLAFHRDAFAFASRPLEDADGNSLTLPDPQTGLVFRLERIREYKQTAYELDILFGVALVRREFACIIAG